MKPKQISGELGVQPLGTFPQTSKTNDHTGKPAKGHKKHKHSKFFILKILFFFVIESERATKYRHLLSHHY